MVSSTLDGVKFGNTLHKEDSFILNNSDFTDEPIEEHHAFHVSPVPVLLSYFWKFSLSFIPVLYCHIYGNFLSPPSCFLLSYTHINENF